MCVAAWLLLVLTLVSPVLAEDPQLQADASRDHSFKDVLFKLAADALLAHGPPVVYDRMTSPDGTLTHRVASLTVNLQKGNTLWEAIAHASRHRWDASGVTYERQDGGLTLVVGLHEYRWNLCAVLDGGKVFSPPPAPGTKVVLIGDFDSNFGMLSTVVANRTVDWVHVPEELQRCLPDSDAAPAADPEFQPPGTPPRRYVGMEGLQAFLDDERLLLWAVNQHQAAPPAPHAKLLSLPLGLPTHGDEELWRTYRRYVGGGGGGALQLPPRRVLLAVNNSGWQHRAAINARVNATFGGALVNSYASGRPYWEILLESKFVLAPSGMGYDCYRVWEVLAHGAIPIVEWSPGLDRTYAALPVLTIADWADITPALLEEVWQEYTVERAAEWDFRRLTEKYWLELLADAAAAGSIDAITAQHPLRTEPHHAAVS